jgi:hypothetical protein
MNVDEVVSRARVVRCAVLVVAFMLMIIFGPGQW